jgi:rhodanese-related sulfurtransferase
MNVPTISPARLDELRRGGAAVELIDVRTPAEFRALHAAGARNVPLDRLDPAALIQAHAGQPLYVICRSGSRAVQACQNLLAAGHAGVVSVEGGTQAWEQAGLPVVRGQKAMSLERQVRIAAGALVLVGAVLALLVDPWFLALSAFIGAGLVFAGITDTCGMALLLARMPWNQVHDSPACCGAQHPAKGGLS